MSDPKAPAKACVIWMHGLGADAQDMQGLAEQLDTGMPVRHVFLNAPVRPIAINNNMPMRAWYNIVGLNLTDREDKDGILQSEQLINQAIQDQVEQGFSSRQIYLAGFSQGGAMALFTGLRHDAPLAGIIALSSYLPLAAECASKQRNSLPMFVAYGEMDDIVLPEWSKLTINFLQAWAMTQLTVKSYPMTHAVCIEELKDLNDWLTAQFSGSVCQAEENHDNR